MATGSAFPGLRFGTIPRCRSLSTNSGARTASEGKRLRIAQVTSASKLIYGAMISLMTLADALREEGHYIRFETWRGRDFGREVRQRGYSAGEVKVRTKIDPLAIGALIRSYRREEIDVVHTHLSTSSVNGCLAARLARIPSVATVHGMSGKLSFLAADRLIAVSKGVRDHLVAQGLDGRKIDVVYNGLVLPDQFPDRASSRAHFGFSPSETVIGTVARIVEVKGYDDLLRAFAILAEDNPLLRFLLVGSGEEEQRFRALATELRIGDRTLWAGYQDPVWSALAAMDAFAFASHKEAMGIAVAEAMAASLPIVSTDVGGLPEVIEGTGWMVPPHRPDLMAKALADAIEHEEISVAKGRLARERALQTFGVDQMRKGTLEIYDRLILQKLG